MLRRSRISVRPNVRPAGRGPAPASFQDTPPSQEAPAAVSQASEDLPQAGGQCVKDTTTTAALEESTTPREDGKDPNGEASSSTPSAGLQRRKRFSVMPNLAKPRVAATPALTRSSPRTPKSPVRAGTETPAPTPEAPEAPSQTDSGPPQGMRSPRRRPSGGSRQAKGQPKSRPLSPASPGPTTTSLGNVAVENSSSSQQTPQAAGKGSIQSDLLKKTPIIKVPSTPLEMVPSSSLPDKEGISVSERAKTLVARSVSGGLTGLAPGKSRLSRFLNDPTDLQRLAKARKLRELLRQEMNKEKKRSKAKVCVSEYTLDPSKMTMRDLIYYLPDTNPMTSYLVEEQRENETVLPLTPPREESPERPPTPEAPAEIASQGDEDEDEDEDDDGVMVPRVKVAEDGSLIIDEESLTVEVLRQKGPNPADDRDPIFERGSTTTYSSFRKGTHVKPWSNKETDMFFLAISMVGTDFSMIGQLFPHRGRTEIKNKFKKEERANSWRIDKAFKEKRRLDHEFFTSLLEKILAAEAKRNKNNKSPTEKIRIKKKIKQKEKKAAKQLSDVEEEGLDAEMDTEEVEGEKENENVSNEGTTLSSAPTPKRKRKSRDGGGESSPEEAKDGKKKKIDLITSDQEEAGVPEDSEAGPPESSKQAEGPVEAAKGPVVIKPAQLSRGRSQKPLPNLGRKWGQRGPEPNTKPNVKDGATPTEEENTEEGLSEEQVDKDASPSVSQKEKKKAGQLSSSEGEEEEANDKPIKPTRYGRIPKKTQLLNYPAKEDGDSPSDSAPTPASDGSPSTMPKSKPATRRAKIKPGPALPGRMGQSAARKSKLVTLRASQSEDEDEDEEEGAWREEAQAEEDTHNPTSPEEENQAPAFIPMSLRSPQPVATEVEETMEELDISVNVPDVLGISHDAFCPDSSCERAQGGEMGTVPCEHQLDLLVDVIDFLSPDNMEVSEESYNEAARTLLAIGNLTHLSQAAEAFTAGADDIITEERSNEDQLYQMTPQPTDQSQTSTIPSESLRVTEASRIAEDSVPVASSTTASVPVTTTTASIPDSKITACVIITMATASVPVTTTTSSPPVTFTTTASIRVTTSTASVPVPQSSDMPTLETPPIEGPLRQMEGTDIGHASKMESGSEVSEGSEQQTTSQSRRSHFPKVKPNVGRAARTTQPKQTTTPLSEPTQTTTTLSEPPLEPMLNITTTSEPQPTMHITTEPPLPTESINTESETQPKQRTTTHSKSQTTTTHSKHQPTTNIIPHSEPPPIQKTRIAYSKPQPTLNTTTNTLSKQQSTQSTTILSQPQPTPSLEQPSPVTFMPIVPESPLTSSEEVKGHDGRKGNTSSSLSAGGSQSGTSDSDQPKQTGPLTRRARLPKPKPNLGLTAKAATRSAVQVPESRPSTEVQTPEEADEVPMEIQQIHQVVPLSDIIDTTQEEIQQIHQVIPHPPIEGPLRQREGTDIGHASQVESGSEVSEGSEQQTTSQTRRSHFPKVKPNLGRAARTTQPKQTTTTMSEPPLDSMLNITTTSEPQPSMIITIEPPLPTESINTESETQPKQRTTTHSKSQPTTNIIPHSGPQPSQRTRVAHSKPQPTLNTTTQSEPPQPTLNSTTNTLAKQQSTQSTTKLSQPHPTPSLEQPGPVRLRPRVPGSPLRASGEVKGHDGSKENTSSSLRAGGSQSGTSDSDQPKQTGPPTRRARLPKPKPNLGCTAKAATCSAVQVPDVASRPKSEVQRLDTGPCLKVQTPEEADEVPMEIQQIHQVVPLSDIVDTTQEEIQQIHQVIPHPPIEEGPLRQREGTDIGHASQVESGSEVSEGSEQQTTSQTRRSYFPKVKSNLGRAARTTQPKQTTTTLSEPTQTTTTLSEPPLDSMLNITTTSEPQPSMIITIEPPLPTESINTESETQPKQRTTTHSKSQPTTNIIPHSGPQPSQRTRVAHSKPQPTLNTTTQSEPPQPTLNSTTNTLSKQQSTESTTILSPQPTSSLEQPGPVTLRPIVPESPLRSSEEVKGHDGHKGNTSSCLRAGGSQSGTTNSDEPKQTGPPTRRARLPKPKPNLGCTAKATTRSAVQVPESRPSPEVQTPEEADEVPIEIQQIHQVFPLCDIIDTTQEEIQQIHQVIPHPPIEEGPLRQREGTDIGHASQVESGSEVSEGSEQQTTSQTRRSHFPKVKPNLGRAARTTQTKPQQTNTTLSEPPQTTNTLSEPQPIQRTRVAHSKPQPALNTTTQSEPLQPTLNSTTNTLSKQQSTESTTILSPQPTSSLEQPGPVTLRPIVPESPLRSSEEVKGHDGPKENSSSSFSAGGSQSATSDSEQPKQTGPTTRRARLPKPKPNLGLTARAATRSAVQVPEGRPSPEVQIPEEDDEVPMEIQQIHQVSPLCDIIDTTQEEMEQIHQVISLTDVIDSTQGDMSVFTEGSFFSQQSDAIFIQHSETSVSTAPLDQAQSDPDEPIFILSLTEIPVLPAGEENGCTSQTLSEPFLFLPDAGAQLQQSSDIVAPGGGLEKGNDGVLCEVPEPMSVDEVLPQPSYTSIKEVESGSTAGPVGVCASAKPSEDSMADAETSEDTHPPSKKRKAPERARRDKLQVRPNTAVREQTSCSAPAKEAVSPITPDQTPSLTTTTLNTYHPTASSPLAQPGPSVTGTVSRQGVADEPQQGTVGCFDRTETEHTPTGGEDNSSGAESQAARQITPLAMSGPLSRPGRRPRGFLSFMSNKNASPVAAPPRGTRAAARRPQVNTTRPGGKRAAPAPAPSTTTRTMLSPSIMHYTTTPTRAPRTTTKPDSSARVTQEKPSDALALHSDPEPSTSLCTTATESSQVPAAQPSASPCVDSGSADEEPINVSQYFFSDIFTEVEENEG